MYRSPEIKTIYPSEMIWWDRKNDIEFRQSATGTIVSEQFGKLPRLQQRRIQRVEGKQVHVCGGELEFLPRDCEPLKAWLRCKTCGKEFLAEV